ncbi:MAG: hypothetical protein LBP87_09370 [Planctomycetaceae bacterium]|jgi:hypothetical protein|nr:hypothetical protein [Planctomycetaceae bacterium]
MTKIWLILLRVILFAASFFVSILFSSAEEHIDTEILSGFDKGPAALEFSHFPSRLHTFIGRNWSVVPVQRLANVLETSVENVNRIAVTMGLPPQQNILSIWESSQGYITVLRRNWHLLPFSQILVLLNQTPEQLAESLHEDDFLFIKLGSVKPQCEPLRFAEPTEEQTKQAQKIVTWIQEELGNDWTNTEEPRFEFLKTFFPNETKTPEVIATTNLNRTDSSPFEIRFLFSYFATFGDPLLDPEIKSYPDELLRQLSQHGVNGIWLHTVLRTLAPSNLFPEFGNNHEIRLKSLQTLVDRAKRYGIKVYLYMNEPRAMPNSFFTGDRTKFAGVSYGSQTSLCTSTPEIQHWLADSLSHVFKNVSGLGGIFTITASENHTNCSSHYRKDQCPRCKNRSVAEIITEVNRIMADAVHRVAPDANVFVWDWGWNDEVATEIITKLPDSVWLMSVSEWSLPIERGGVKSNVGEYSISSVGPGPRAVKHWTLARQRGLKTIAKVQFNVTWEIASIPYLPVADLIAEHAVKLSGSGVNGLMLGWSLGGYPSPNLEIAHLAESQKINADEILNRIAVKYYGNGAASAREAWTIFSNGFREFPYHIGLCYSGPQHWGAANLVFSKRTGYRATMVGIPYDDVQNWCAVYPPEIAAGQFRKVAEHFAQGLEPLRRAVDQSPAEQKLQTESEFRFAKTAQLHFASSANMIEFNTLRNICLDTTNETEKEKYRTKLRTILADELHIAKEMYCLAKSDSRIGYESSNHYFYIPIDIAEKIISIRYFLEHF